MQLPSLPSSADGVIFAGAAPAPPYPAPSPRAAAPTSAPRQPLGPAGVVVVHPDHTLSHASGRRVWVAVPPLAASPLPVAAAGALPSCPLCLDVVSASVLVPAASCGHCFCRLCLRRCWTAAIADGNPYPRCPYPACHALPPDSVLAATLDAPTAARVGALRGAAAPARDVEVGGYRRPHGKVRRSRWVHAALLAAAGVFLGSVGVAFGVRAPTSPAVGLAAFFGLAGGALCLAACVAVPRSHGVVAGRGTGDFAASWP